MQLVLPCSMVGVKSAYQSIDQIRVKRALRTVRGQVAPGVYLNAKELPSKFARALEREIARFDHRICGRSRQDV